MKNFNELNYYEMLEIPADSSDFEIRQAYKDTLSIYNEDSSVTYSLFSNEERTHILKNIDAAFSILIDQNTRRDYNKKLVQSGQIKASDLQKTDKHKLVSMFGDRNSGSALISKKKIEKKVQDEDIKVIIAEILSKEFISGRDLKRIRQAMGVELEDVYEATRISINVLTSLENDDFEKLPSGSYTQNFLKIYSGFLKIDHKKITEGYLNNINNK